MNPKPIQQSIDPRLVRTDLNTQAREKTCDVTVREYAEAMESGRRFPPIIVFLDIENDLYILADGFHRLFAHLRTKPNDPIIVEQYLGNVKDALRYAVCANQSHGLKRTNGDKRKAIERYMLELEGASESDRCIAKKISVCFKYVGNIRRRLIVEKRLCTVHSRIGADGRTYNISNIGQQSDTEKICGGCGHYESPYCIIEGVVRAPIDPACEEFVVREDEEPDTVEDTKPEIGEPGDADEYIPKEVKRRAGRRKRGEYVNVPLSRTNTDHAASKIRLYFDDNYLAALAQSSLKLLKESK